MQKMFSKYPDVVSITELMEILKIEKNIAYSLLREEKIKNIKLADNIKFLNVTSLNI